MISLLKLLLENVRLLDELGDEAVRRLKEIPSRRPHHNIKHRVKSANGIEAKLRAKGQFDGAPAPVVSLPDLMASVTDLVGARVVFTFKHDVHDFALALAEGGPSVPVPQFEVLQTEIYCSPADREAIVAAWNRVEPRPRIKTKLSGYTSVHFLARLPDSNCPARFNGLQFEIQVRTALEDAWAEAEHLTAYKRFASPRIRSLFHVLSEQVQSIDRLFQVVAEQALEERRAKEAEYRIQVTKSYPWTAPGVPEEYRSVVLDAYAEREAGRHTQALRLHRQLVKDPALLRLLPGGEPPIDMVDEYALDHLYLHGADSVQFAYETYKKEALSRDPSDFWANFRLAYIHYQWANFEGAVGQCERALQILQERGGAIEGYDCTGLKSDVTVYMANCLWQRARLSYGEKADRQAASEMHMEAIRVTEEALRLADAEGDAAQARRCNNNLAYLHTQLRDQESLKKAEQYLALLPDGNESPVYATTRAWHSFVSGQKERALRAIESALDQANRMDEQHLPGHLKEKIRRYHRIIYDDYYGVKAYEEGDDY